jgi:uncharacterized membrane protein YfhO
LDLLSVKYLVKLKQEEEVPNAENIWQNEKWEIWQRGNVQPRAYLSTNYILAKNEKEFLEKTYLDKTDLNKLIVVSKNPGFEPIEGNIKKAKILEYSANKVVIEAEADKKSLLYLSDTYYPEWKAYVDGNEADIIRGNFAFRAVTVPEGKHKVVFKYSKTAFKYGLLVSGLCLSGMVLIYVKFINKKLQDK